jgi:carbon-monoxide dehydrogenase small subunit
MIITLKLNNKKITEDVAPDLTLLEFVRSHDCKSVKCGCDTTNCGLCTVFVDDKPILSCALLAVRCDGKRVTTLEGLQKEAEEFGGFIADQGAEQCGFCNPGFIMNAIALFRENAHPSDEEIKRYLAGNLCRCSGYEGQMRGIKAFMEWKESKEKANEAGK